MTSQTRAELGGINVAADQLIVALEGTEDLSGLREAVMAGFAQTEGEVEPEALADPFVAQCWRVFAALDVLASAVESRRKVGP